MKVTILFWASLRDCTGVSQTELDLPGGATEPVFWNYLLNHFPALEPYRKVCRIAVNAVYADDRVEFRDGDEVALIPPVSGG